MKDVVVHNKNIILKGMMKVIPFFLVLSSACFAQVDPQNPQDLIDYRRAILQTRVEEVMKARLTAINACLKNSFSDEVQSISFELAKEIYLSKGRNLLKLMHLMDLFRKTEALKKSKCTKELKAADLALHKLERKKFDWVYKLAPTTCLNPTDIKCTAKRIALIAHIDPHCVTNVSESYDGNKDGNACFAGINIAIQALKKFPESISLTNEMDSFLISFSEIVSNAKDSDEVEWTRLFPNYWKFGRDKRDLLYLAIMEYFMLATTSNAGIVEAFGDHFWMQPLKNGLSAGAALKNFEQMKNRKDFFRDTLTTAEEKKIVFSYGHFKMANANRHNYMSALLACDLKKKFGTFDSHLVPLILGYAYEAKDFASHIKGGISLEKSLENFVKDTSRYKQGMKIGNSLCE